ncbi:hypothetical protein BDF19DRAFT_451955 [Syncephalis fuscata]|nr:hypothetical protein BDF19DRAFT_451955 [Syncephalis fuscata]
MNSFGLNPTDPFSQTGMNSFGSNSASPFPQTGMNSFGLNPTDPFSQTGMNSMIGSPVRQNNRINTQNILSSLGQSNSGSSEAAMKSKQNVELLRDHYQRQAELRQNVRSNQRF